MKVKRGLCLVALMVSALTLQADDKVNKKDVVRTLDVKRVTADRRGRVNKPKVLKTADEMAKAIKVKDVVARLQKDVNFEKENVVLFSWFGSGRDKLSFRVAEEGKVVFEYKPGLTRDLRPHVHGFAVSKKAEWKFERKPFRRGR